MKLAVISGKGGSGKSSITAALISLSRRRPVVAVDCDVDASNLPLLFPHETETKEKFVSGQEIHIDTSGCIGCGQCAEHCAFGAIRIGGNGKPEAEPLLCEGCGFCMRICPVQAITVMDVAASTICTSSFSGGKMVHGVLRPGDDNSGKMIARIRTIADRLMEEEKIGLQILDGPPGIGCPVLSTVTGMDRILIVTEPSLSGLSDLQRAFTVASSYCNDIKVIINKCDLSARNTRNLSNFCRTAGIPIVAELPFDRKLLEAQLQQMSIIDYAPDSSCAGKLSRAYAEIIS